MKIDDQSFWNFLASISFATLLFASSVVLVSMGKLPSHIGIFDFVLLSLATFRVVRLFVYDKITKFLRNIFLKREEVDGIFLWSKYTSGPLRTVSDLLDCPWCLGVWAALPIVFFYFLTPLCWYPICMLAVAGMASFIQLSANTVGWTAEHLKNRNTEPSVGGRC
jgi:hypothetical protein